jgi:hypothetical protein
MKFLKSLLFFVFILLLASCSEEPAASTGSTYPDTEIVGEEPIVVGHIVEVLEEKQMIVVVEGVTKEEALEIDAQTYELSMASFASNATRFEGAFKKGDKVAVWKFEEGPETAGEVAERIVLLER